MTAALTDIQWAQLQEAWRVVDSDADGLVTCGMLSGSAWDAEAARTQEEQQKVYAERETALAVQARQPGAARWLP